MMKILISSAAGSSIRPSRIWMITRSSSCAGWLAGVYCDADLNGI